MTSRRPRWAGAAALLATVPLATPAPEQARVFVGGWIGPPVLAVPGPYPYPYPYPYVPVYPVYPYGGAPVPPPGWVPGHWEVRQDPSGQSMRVWVPSYLQ
jgi:hypothetical protein